MRTNILLALTDQTWQLQVMTALNDNSQIKIRRRCVDSVDLMSAIHLGLANKVVISAGFENLNSTTISGAKKLGCDVYGIYLENDVDSLEKLVGVGVKSNFAIDETDVEKSLKGLINLLLNQSGRCFYSEFTMDFLMHSYMSTQDLRLYTQDSPKIWNINVNSVSKERSKYVVYSAILRTFQSPVVLEYWYCLLYTSPSPRDLSTSRMPSSA